MMRLFFVFVFFAFCLNIYGQTNYVAILWDVTWSMQDCRVCAGDCDSNKTREECGEYNVKDDIWLETKEGLINIINNQDLNGSVMLDVIPFDVNDNPYVGKSFSSFNSNDKKEVIEWINSFELDENRITRTDVCGALETVYRKMQNKNAVTNQLYLLTDGDQTAVGYNNDCLCEKVQTFCQSFCETDVNKLLILELKTLSTKCDFTSCGCVDKVSVKCPDKFGYSLTPSPSNIEKTITSNSEIKIVINFQEGLDEQPQGFNLSPNAESDKISIANYSFDSNENQIEIILKTDAIQSGQQENFKINFNGVSSDNCYDGNISIGDVDITIINQDVWEVIIPNNGVKSINK